MRLSPSVETTDHILFHASELQGENSGVAEMLLCGPHAQASVLQLSATWSGFNICVSWTSRMRLTLVVPVLTARDTGIDFLAPRVGCLRSCPSLQILLVFAHPVSFTIPAYLLAKNDSLSLTSCRREVFDVIGCLWLLTIFFSANSNMASTQYTDGRQERRVENYTKFWQKDLGKEGETDSQNRVESYTDVVNGTFCLVFVF
jgi:hypothetical protein